MRIDDLIELHRAYWKLENEKPLLNIMYRENFPWMWMQSDHIHGMELFLKDGTTAKDGPLTPDMLSPENMHPKPFTQGDLFLPIVVFRKIPWIEAICGITPQLHTKANSIWAGFGKGVWPNDWWEKGMKVEIKKEWLNLLIEATQYCVEKYSDTFVITQSNMRGSMDIVAALIGDENCVVAMYEHPKEFHKLMDQVTDILIRVKKAQNDVIPSFKGGYVDFWGVWAPGTIARHQEDEAAYISPRFYREFVMPYDKKICQAFDYTSIHFHAAHHVHGDAVTDIDELGALQYSLEPPPYGLSFSETIPLLKRLIRKKPLILQAWNLTRDQINTLLRELPPQGLLLETHVQEAGESYYIYRE